MIYYHTPYDLSGNLGRYYNQVMSELKDDKDWVVFTDRDVWFPDPKYGELIASYSENLEYGLLTCRTNRVGTNYQCVNRVFWDVENAKDHVNIAKALRRDYNCAILDITNEAPLSGMLIMIQKSCWLKTTGFLESGILGVDNSIHTAVRESNQKVGLMLGLYVWHYYRNGEPNDRSHL